MHDHSSVGDDEDIDDEGEKETSCLCHIGGRSGSFSLSVPLCSRDFYVASHITNDGIQSSDAIACDFLFAHRTIQEVAYVIAQIALHFFMAQHFKGIRIEAEIGLDVHHGFYIFWEICHLGNGFLVHKVELRSGSKQRVVKMTLIDHYDGAIFSARNAT